ncbi:hypothetical protein GF351_02830, partial [Candidatus Woesearchaeota archaeon]|nr:hypothetical protein [Candidatus Woesearchaeota archaeon]
MLVESFSGIRGIYGKGLDEDVARKYTQAYANLLKNRESKEEQMVIAIGRDTRESSPLLMAVMKDVLVGNGYSVIDLGVAPTPAVEFAVREYDADGGIMITGSHNEPEYNGFKFLDKDGAVLRPEDADMLIRSWKDAEPADIGEGVVIDKHEDLAEKYADFVV